MDSSRYEARGVSSDKNEVHRAIKKLDHGLFKHSFCKIMENPYSLDGNDGMILHADTAGTKPILAYLYWKELNDINVWKGIAQDALVMNLDDMACCGVVNNFVLSNTILRNKNRITADVLEAIIEGTIDFIETMKNYGVTISHAGGETADVGDVVRTMDVGFTAYAQKQKSAFFINHIQQGDLILGLHSFGQTQYEKVYNSGIGCNGLTSARHDVLNKDYAFIYPETFEESIDASLVYSGSYKMSDVYHHQNTSYLIGNLLTSPTRTYIPFLKELFEQNPVGLHGVIHCTGGAHSKVLKFIDPVNIIKDNMPIPAPIFKLIKDCSQSSWQELYKVLNMGIRLEIYGSENAITCAKKIADQFNIGSDLIGKVEKSDKPRVTMRAFEDEWNYE